MKCNMDCFNCIYPDCINDYVRLYNSERRKKYYAEHRDLERDIVDSIKDKRKSVGICIDCGVRPIATRSKCRCAICLEKQNQSKKRKYQDSGEHISRELLDGVERCKHCGRVKPVQGYMLCEKCLEVSRKNVAKAHLDENNYFRLTMENFFRKKVK